MKELFEKGFRGGQAVINTIIITSILSTSASWMVNHFFGAPGQLAASVTAVEGRVGQIEEGNKFRDQNYAKLEGDVEYIRRSIEEQNKRQGIIIDTIKE